MRVEASSPAFVLALRDDGAAAAAPAVRGVPADVLLDVGVPATPPAEVVEAVRHAAQVAADLALQNRELHFSKDAVSGRVIVEVRDLRGVVIRTVPPSTALETLAPGVWR